MSAFGGGRDRDRDRDRGGDRMGGGGGGYGMRGRMGRRDEEDLSSAVASTKVGTVSASELKIEGLEKGSDAASSSSAAATTAATVDPDAVMRS